MPDPRNPAITEAYTERLHPRGRGGQWVRSLRSLKPGQSVVHKGVKVTHVRVRDGEREYRVTDPHGTDQPNLYGEKVPTHAVQAALKRKYHAEERDKEAKSGNPNFHTAAKRAEERAVADGPDDSPPRPTAKQRQTESAADVQERLGHPQKVGKYTAKDYGNEQVNYGGEMMPRHKAIADMRKQGASQAQIDRWLQGADLNKKRSERDAMEPGSPEHVAATREIVKKATPKVPWTKARRDTESRSKEKGALGDDTDPRTPAGKKKGLEFFKTLKLAELRRRQDLATEQIKLAFEQKNTDALERLQKTHDLLSAAVHYIAFEKKAKKLKEAVEQRKAAAEAGDSVMFTHARAREEAIREELALEERATFGTHFDPRLHPRNRLGEFVNVLAKLRKDPRGSDVRLPHGITVSHKTGGSFEVRTGSTRVGRHLTKTHAAAKALDHFDRAEGPHPFIPLPGIKQTRRAHTSYPERVMLGMAAGKNGKPGVGERALILPETTGTGHVSLRGIVTAVGDGHHEIRLVTQSDSTKFDSTRVLHPISREEGGMGAGKRVMGSDAARAVGRFKEGGSDGYKAATWPGAKLRKRKETAVEDERKWLENRHRDFSTGDLPPVADLKYLSDDQIKQLVDRVIPQTAPFKGEPFPESDPAFKDYPRHIAQEGNKRADRRYREGSSGMGAGKSDKLKVGDMALDNEGRKVEIIRVVNEDGVEFAWVRYSDGDGPANAGGRVAGTPENPVFEKSLTDRQVVSSNADYYDPDKWYTEPGLRPLHAGMGAGKGGTAAPRKLKASDLNSKPYFGQANPDNFIRNEYFTATGKHGVAGEQPTLNKLPTKKTTAAILQRPAHFGRAGGNLHRSTMEKRDVWIVDEYEKVTGKKAKAGAHPSIKDPMGFLKKINKLKEVVDQRKAAGQAKDTAAFIALRAEEVELREALDDAVSVSL